MQSSTWVDRITDESNPWLNAIKSEDERDFASAVTLYLRDASENLERNMPAKAALSSSCAADCLERLSLFGYARLLYRETAAIYAENADRVAGTSVREMLWSLQESSQFYLMSGEKAKSVEAYKKYLTISKRVNLFTEDRAARTLETGGGVAQTPSDKEDLVPAPAGSRVVVDVEEFLNLRKTGHRKTQKPGVPRTVGPSKPRRGSTYDEKSIINQLG
jgi:hypothetical protein